MASRTNLKKWVEEALIKLGGEGRINLIAKAIWDTHKEEIIASEQIRYSWQYDMRWAAHKLRQQGIIASVESSSRGVWKLHSK